MAGELERAGDRHKASLDLAVRVSSTEKVTFGQRLEESEQLVALEASV